MNHISVQSLELHDAEPLARLLVDGPADYSRYFHPFTFEAATIRGLLARARKDVYFGIATGSDSRLSLAGFYMLRGMDEGYADPMYGVFIGHRFQGQGLARLTLAHAESWCRVNGIARLLLKVHPENKRARQLYEGWGFKLVREDASNHNLVLGKTLSKGIA